jgi:hypothetical protein
MATQNDLKLTVPIPDGYRKSLVKNFGTETTSPQFIPCEELHPFEKSCVKRYYTSVNFLHS